MIWLPPVWLCLFLVLVGCGLLVVAALQRLAGESFRSPASTFQVFWLGYAFTLAFLELYSLAFAIRWPVPVVLAAFALVGFWISRRPLGARLRAWRARPRSSLAVALIVVSVVLTVAAWAAQPVGWYDTHLYHLQVVKWARTFPAVPGIANLHYRLAYNNSIHLFGALTDTLWKGRASHLTLGILACVVIVQLVITALRFAHGRARTAAGYSWLMLPFVLGRVAGSEIASLSSDLPLNLMCIVIVLELLHWHGETRHRSDLRLATVVALSAVATTTKLGGLGVLVVSGATVAYLLFKTGWSRRRLLGFAGLPALVLLGYVARQSILSGWLLFPAPIGNLHLAWSLPEAETLDQFRWIQSWARVPGRTPADVLDQGMWRWFEPWYGKFARSQELSVFLLAGVLILYRLAQPARLRLPWNGPALAATVLSLVLWFRGAPDLRFGAGFFWMLLAVVGAPLLGAVMNERVGRVLALSLSLALTHWTDGLTFTLPHSGYVTKLAPIHKQDTHEQELSPGLKVRVPSGAEDEDRCSNEPLPCTPYPVQQRLRRSGDLAAGFLF